MQFISNSLYTIFGWILTDFQGLRQNPTWSCGGTNPANHSADGINENISNTWVNLCKNLFIAVGGTAPFVQSIIFWPNVLKFMNLVSVVYARCYDKTTTEDKKPCLVWPQQFR